MEFRKHVEGIEITCDCGRAVVLTPGVLALWSSCGDKVVEELFESVHPKPLCGAVLDCKWLWKWIDEQGGVNLAVGVPFREE